MEARKPSFVCRLFLAIVVLSVSGAASHPNENSSYKEDFEKDTLLSFVVVGIPQGELKDATVTRVRARRGIKVGNHALSFSYRRTKNPLPVLYNPRVLMQDFELMEFWIKSEKAAIWIVSVTDRDKANFSAKKEIPAGRWKKLSLVPSDFECGEDSPVKKDRLEPNKLSFGYANFDVLCILDKKGTNRVLIDDIKILRKPQSMRVINGDYILSGKTEIISSPTRINGDIKLVNGAKLIVDTDRFEVNGSVLVVGSTVIMQNGIWLFPQEYRYQHAVVAAQNGRIEFINGSLSTNKSLSAAALTNSTFRFDNVKNVDRGFTFGTDIEGGTTVEVIRSDTIGEFIIDSNVNFKVEESNLILIWLKCGEGVKSTLRLPSGKNIEEWQSPSGLSRSISVKDSKNVLWGFIGSPGSEVTFKKTKLFAAGIYFVGGVNAKVENIKNNTRYDDFTLDAGAGKLQLIDSTVRAWNFYTDDTSELELHNCFYGESISFGKSKIRMYNSFCDGSGGYFGAKDNSKVTFSSGEITGQILTHGKAEVIIEDSKIGGEIIAAEESEITLINSKAIGPINQIGKGKVYSK